MRSSSGTRSFSLSPARDANFKLGSTIARASRAFPDAAKLNSRYPPPSLSLEREREETRPMQCTRSLTRALKGPASRADDRTGLDPERSPCDARPVLPGVFATTKRSRVPPHAAPLHAAVAAAFSVAFSRYGKADWAKCKNTGFIGRVYLA